MMGLAISYEIRNQVVFNDEILVTPPEYVSHFVYIEPDHGEKIEII